MKKKCSDRVNGKKSFFKKHVSNNKVGMTYVELLTALALLALIITSFTPMLLSSYQTLYNAGEKVQNVYESKEEMEEGLARRDSENKAAIKLNMLVNGDILFNQINVVGRKVISTFEQGLETVFGQIRPRVEIISASTVYDNFTNHDVIIQTYGLDYETITFGDLDITKTPEQLGFTEKRIHIKVLAPNKTAKKSSGPADENMIGTEDKLVYNSGYLCPVQVYTSKFQAVDPADIPDVFFEKRESNRFKLKINSPDGIPLDFTYSPLKIAVYYLDSRGEIRTISDYLYIDPPSLLMAGETKEGIDYYTSAGIEIVDRNETDDETKRQIEYMLRVEGRKMRTANSQFLNNIGQHGEYASSAVGAPSVVRPNQERTEIRSIRWIDNDETQGVSPYYVMTGTNGSIYRMYTFSSDKSDIFSAAMGATIYNTKTGYFGGAQNYIDRVYTTERGRKVYPSFWGGDYSHIFEYTSAQRRVTYGPSANYKLSDSKGDEAWLTSATSQIKDGSTKRTVTRAGIVGDEVFNVMSANAQFCYYYNGEGTEHSYGYKNARPLSYILTERGWPIRLTGVIGPIDKDDPFNLDATDLYLNLCAFWDGKNITSNIRSEEYYWDSSQVLAFHYKYKGHESQDDYSYGGIRLKALASYPVKNFDGNADYLNSSADDNNTTSMGKIANVRAYTEKNDKADRTSGYSNDVNITDVIYIPSTDTTQGSTFYVGNVHGYANLVQNVKISGTDAYHVQAKTHEYVYYEWSDGVLGIGRGWKKKTKTVDPIEDDRAEKTFGEGVAVPSGVSHVGKWYRNASEGGFIGIGEGNGCSYPKGSITDYFIFSNHDGTATYVAKFNDNDYARMSEDDRQGAFGAIEVWLASNDATVALSQSAPNNETEKIMFYSVAGATIYDGADKKTETKFFLPSMNCAWEYLYYDDVYFTFGYSSNRERVYTNITYDGVTEYTRSYERLYFRSHYGQDAAYYTENVDHQPVEYSINQSAYSETLPIHYPNRAVSNGWGGMQTSDAFLNKEDNDYYNVWFPGEMYNLTKIASKDGVTVAVGYAVAASSYQHALASDSSVTSTGLGSIYNDGVLSAMIEGKDDALVNLLYYKDNATFDDYSLYSAADEDKNNTLKLNQYAEYGNIKYGMHGRDSIQFTAVDLLVENKKKSETSADYTVNYYAYYGDNKGRVFYSLVATGSGSNTAEGEMNASEAGAELVPYISDKPTRVESRSVAPSQMVEVTVGGQGLDKIFSRIVTIDAKDDMIIITGEMVKGTKEYIVVGTKSADGSFKFVKVLNCGFNSVINDATIVGGYYYIVGENTPNPGGWVAGISIETLKSVVETALNNGATETSISTPSLTDEASGSKSADSSQLLWRSTDVKLYAIAGRDTK